MTLLFVSILSMVTAGTAHPGHGSTVVTGTVLSTSPTAVMIEVRDLASLTTRTVRVLVNADTKYRIGKERVNGAQAQVGTRVEALVDYEEGPSGDTIYLARELKLSKPKGKR